METTQSLPPSLIIFIFFSLTLSIWAIVEIIRSAFTKVAKVLWILVVVFAPFGVFIYIFLGRRWKPLPPSLPAEETSSGAPAEGAQLREKRQARWPAPLTLLALAVFCILLYFKAVSFLGQEKTALLLIAAMIVIGAVLTFSHLSQARKKQ